MRHFINFAVLLSFSFSVSVRSKSVAERENITNLFNISITFPIFPIYYNVIILYARVCVFVSVIAYNMRVCVAVCVCVCASVYIFAFNRFLYVSIFYRLRSRIVIGITQISFLFLQYRKKKSYATLTRHRLWNKRIIN